MAQKRMCTYYLSDELIKRVQTLQMDTAAHEKLGLKSSVVDTRKPDHRGLLPEDYAELQKLTGSRKTGDALIQEAWLHPACKTQVRVAYRKALIRNRRMVARQTISRGDVSISRIVDALLRLGLTQLNISEPVKNASSKSSGGSRRNVRKVA